MPIANIIKHSSPPIVRDENIRTVEPSEKTNIPISNDKNRDSVVNHSRTFIRYYEVYYLVLNDAKDFEKFRNLQATNINNREPLIHLSANLDLALVFECVEVHPNPTTIPLMPESVRRLYKLGEYAPRFEESGNDNKQTLLSDTADDSNVSNASAEQQSLFGE